MTEKTNQSENKQVTDEEKKDQKFDSSTNRNKTLASHKCLAFLGAPHRTCRQKRYILNLRKHFLSYALRRREMNSLEVLNALHHLSVRYARIYPANQLPRVWTRSTAIVANHDQPGQHWIAFYIDDRNVFR